LRSLLSRHREAILAALRNNQPIAHHIIQDLRAYSMNISDMLALYNRHLHHCRVISTWENIAKTEADDVLAKLKTNIRQMLDRHGLTVAAVEH